MTSHATTTVTTTDADAVAAAVAALGPLDREALLLRVRGRSFEAVAELTGTTPAMVRVRLHRAAAAVERRVDLLPTDGTAVSPDRSRATADVVADAEVGITPILHARLVAALAQAQATTGPRFRRTAAVLQSVAEHATPFASLGNVAGLAAVTVVALAGVV